MTDNTVTLVGNLTADPELRFTPNGTAVANITVAHTPRTFDRQTGEWKDADTLFLVCNIWRDHAEHATESLSKGDRIIVTGNLKQRRYTTKDGDTRTVTELDVDDIGPSLRYATAKPRKATRQPATPGDDPWGSAPAADN